MAFNEVGLYLSTQSSVSAGPAETETGFGESTSIFTLKNLFSEQGIYYKKKLMTKRYQKPYIIYSVYFDTCHI